MQVTIRPNLNMKPYTTIHKGKLGLKMDSKLCVSIICNHTVIRNSGLMKVRKQGEKTVFCGLVGELLDYVVIPSPQDKIIKFNPAYNDSFTVNGEVYKGGGIVTAYHGRYYLINNY